MHRLNAVASPQKVLDMHRILASNACLSGHPLSLCKGGSTNSRIVGGSKTPAFYRMVRITLELLRKVRTDMIISVRDWMLSHGKRAFLLRSGQSTMTARWQTCKS